MNCAEFDEIVHDLDRSDVEPRPAGGAILPDTVLAHAESCSRCARLLTELEGLNFALHAIAARDAQEQAPADVETALLRAFREQAAASYLQDERKLQVAGKPRRWAWYAATSAAVVLLFIGLMRGWIGTAPLQPVENPTNAVAGTSAGSKTPLPVGQSIVSPESPATTVTSGAASQVAQATSATDDPSAFYALPYADDVASVEGGAVIRVSVPRSTLAAWGLPIQGLEQAGAVPADLLVSADGTPQAIRLVSEANE